MADSRIERWLAGGWRAPLLAALIALAAGLPGLIAMPVLDRDEPRFAEASAQMLESGDFVSIRFLDAPRNKKPVGIHWLQAASVAAFSSASAHQIWAYRLPSLLGAMLAAAGCAWGAAAFFGPRGAAIAGGVLGASFILSTEAFLATTDAALCAAITWMMAALARVYAESRGEPVLAGFGTKTLFWAGLAASLLLKGPIGPMVAALTMLALWAQDRSAAWLKGLGWGWGTALVLAVCGPWALAITVSTDGSFWSGAVMGDMVSKLAAGQESHGAPPGLHLLLAPVLLFPATLLLPAALAWGLGCRSATAARFALAWLVPSWIVFELAPTKLPHYTLPLYGALAWLIAGALTQPIGRASRIAGASLGALIGLALAAAAVLATFRYGSDDLYELALPAAIPLAAAGLASLLVLRERRAEAGLALAGALTIVGHGMLAAHTAPGLHNLWVSARAARAVRAVGIDPQRTPVTVAGYEEPSLVFLLGSKTELGEGPQAAEAIAGGRPAIVEKRQDAAFQAALARLGAHAEAVEQNEGLDYSKGKPVVLVLYRPARTQEAP